MFVKMRGLKVMEFMMQRSEGGGSFQAIDTMNAKLLCGCDDIHACVVSPSVASY